MQLFFTPKENIKGVQAKVTFPNGYGASVIKGLYSIGGPDGLYELAVINHEGHPLYDTPITDDVLGHLTLAAVQETLTLIAALPARNGEI